MPLDVVTILEALGDSLLPGSSAALESNIFHVNATAPFQQLVQHYNTPWGTEAFVTNNFMGLIAYSKSTGADSLRMDSGNNLYMGYTFAVQELADALNANLAPHTSYRIPHFDYEASFEQTVTGYNFGINYTNMLVLWQDVDVELRGPDILSAAGLQLPDTKGNIYGQDIVAVSVLDHLAFEYSFEVEEIELPTTPAITINLGTVETKYHIGESSFFATIGDDAAFIAANAGIWEGSPFIESPSYTLDVPAALQGIDMSTYGSSGIFPDSVSITLPEMAFYIENDAKLRMSRADAFGLTVITATNWFDVETVSNPQYATHLDDPENPTIDVENNGNVFFWTSFKDKMTYKLRELDFAPFNIDPDVNRDVYVTLFDPSGWTFTNVAKAYFTVELSLAWSSTVFVASKIAPNIVLPGAGQHTEVVNQFLYLTFTEFPEWYGGEIYHDPTYTAIAWSDQPQENTADWGDIVNVRHTLYEDNNYSVEVPGYTNVELNNIYLSIEQTVPPDILAFYPEARSAFLLKFEEALIGMAINQVKNFTILSEEAYGDGDLYFQVELLSIVYDASEHVSTTNTTTSTTTTTTNTTTSEIISTTEKSTVTTTTEPTTPTISPGFTYLLLVLAVFPVIRKRRNP
ncbi:hypothetical protein CEE45_05570 [Candidatus Heimdallarchaeota archaeon B3_Heim]|nr:MAG: hypothetical protein CEE45_05570 [Candidatus Heimdallarchaeota archaeon B3_Heim]